MTTLSDYFKSIMPKNSSGRPVRINRDKPHARINMDDRPLPSEALGTGMAAKAGKAIESRRKKIEDALKAAGV